MQTRIICEDISAAAEIIKDGGLVAVPTETVYGLAANGLDEAAVERVFKAKGRPESKPLSLMVSGSEMIDKLCVEVPKAAYFLSDVFWPGPLTIVLKAKNGIPDIVRAGGETIGLRCPQHPKTMELLKQCGVPLAAPSANPSGEKSPKTAGEVLACFDGVIDAVIDGGECSIGVESTVIDMSKTPYRILREGAVKSSELDMMLMASMTIIGITGGTGCGKTTALDVLEKMGGLIIDCDAVYHELLQNSDELIKALDERFPGAIPPGTHDTKALGEIVFSDPVELAALNAITHRFVGNEIMRRLSDWAKNGGRVAAIDAIALIESGVSGYCRETVGITAPYETRISRLMKREGISREYAKLRVDAQKPNEYFEENCDNTLCNDGDRQSFETKCEALFSEIIRRNST